MNRKRRIKSHKLGSWEITFEKAGCILWFTEPILKLQNAWALTDKELEELAKLLGKVYPD